MIYSGIKDKKERSPKGFSSFVDFQAASSRNFSIFAAMNENNMLFKKINDTTINREDFKESVISLKQKCTEMGIHTLIFVMDNARIHHYSGLKDI